MIYTVTFNPSLDYIVSMQDFAMGMTNRTVGEQIFPGGKGMGQGPRRAETVHFRPFRRGEPGFLQGHGLRGGAGVPPRPCRGGAL